MRRGKGGYDGPISVAVCDIPDGKYEFYGHVHYMNGEYLRRFVPFDPAVINDDGVIRLYYGTCFAFADIKNRMNRRLLEKIDEIGLVTIRLLMKKERNLLFTSKICICQWRIEAVI